MQITLTANFISVKNVVLTVLVLISMLSAECFSQTLKSMGETINIAGRQRMLSQRIAQSYFLLGVKPDSVRAGKVLSQSVNEFEKNLQRLAEFKPANKVRNDLKAVKDNWLIYKPLAESSVSKANAARLFEESNKILTLAHAYVNALEALSGTQKSTLINVSGRQRMLSQRIAKNFLAKLWGIAPGLSDDALVADINDYEEKLNFLASSAENTDQINDQLANVRSDFMYAKKGLTGAMGLTGRRLILVVTGTTDILLHGMDKTTGMYAELLN